MRNSKTLRVKDKKLLKAVREKGCLICGRISDTAHIKSRGSGGHDSVDNLLPLCRDHHREQHSKGWNYFVQKYEVIKDVLLEKGWEMQTVFGINKLTKTR